MAHETQLTPPSVPSSERSPENLGASGPSRGFLTMRLAAEALQERLTLLLESASDELALHYMDRLQFVREIVALVNPDDIFEQDAFRRSFTSELAQLPHPTGHSETRQ